MAVDLRVLIVEDNRTMGQIERKLLMLIGVKQIENVHDGDTAVRMLRQSKFDLIISDWNMQPMTGKTFLQNVRADPGLAGIPFIVVTAESRLETVAAARDAGASAYIVKPFSGETLKAKIAEALTSKVAQEFVVG
jgi:two-component system chemotaxis response regulator CheY